MLKTQRTRTTEPSSSSDDDTLSNSTGFLFKWFLGQTAADVNQNILISFDSFFDCDRCGLRLSKPFVQVCQFVLNLRSPATGICSFSVSQTGSIGNKCRGETGRPGGGSGRPAAGFQPGGLGVSATWDRQPVSFPVWLRPADRFTATLRRRQQQVAAVLLCRFSSLS